MVFRKGKISDLEGFMHVCRSFFSTHNIFQQSDKKILPYLAAQASEHQLLIYEDRGVVKAGLFLVQTGANADSSHRIWKFRHFAFPSDDIGSRLLALAEDCARSASTTAKIELTIAESEPGKEFYLNHGYVEEGVLNNHYRPREKCYILGKSFL